MLWHLLQTSDSLFPTGAFAHSGGLEGLATAGLVGTAEQTERVIESILTHSFTAVDLPACALSHGASLERLREIDDRVDTLKAPREAREASRSLGRRRLETITGLVRHPDLDSYAGRVRADETPGHDAVVTGLHLAAMNVSKEEALAAYAYTTAAALVSAAMRLLPLGQKRGQALLYRCGELAPEWIAAAQQRELDSLGSFTPLLDIGAMNHEVAHTRIFIS